MYPRNRTLSACLVAAVVAIGALAPVHADPPPPPHCVTPPANLVSWWTGDDTTDDFLGVNNGLPGAVAYTAGKVAGAFTFPGAIGQEVRVPNHASLEPNQITVDAWVRADGSPGNFRYILGKGGHGCSHSSYALYTDANGGLAFYV